MQVGRYKEPFEKSYLFSALLGEVWLSWCRFCREVLILSCAGGRTLKGNPIPSRAADNSPGRIAYEFVTYKQGGRPNATKVMTMAHQEPTWGDVNAILKVIPGLNPSNLANLLTGFGLPLLGPQHLQITRNTIAHLTVSGIHDFNKILIKYSGGNISHPSMIVEMMDQSKNTEVFFSWIEDMEIIASVVVS